MTGLGNDSDSWGVEKYLAISRIIGSKGSRDSKDFPMTSTAFAPVIVLLGIVLLLAAAFIGWRFLPGRPSPENFHDSVSKALKELGIDSSKLSPSVMGRLETECRAYFLATKRMGDARFLAVRFFVFLCAEHSEFPEFAFTTKTPHTFAIDVIRNWSSARIIPSKFAEEEVRKLKMSFVKVLAGMNLETSERLANEIFILEY
jgi:hypothetical protein